MSNVLQRMIEAAQLAEKEELKHGMLIDLIVKSNGIQITASKGGYSFREMRSFREIDMAQINILTFAVEHMVLRLPKSKHQ